MSEPKIFVTGVTGYIGGDAFHTIHEAHPNWQYTCLVRNSDKGATVTSTYPKVQLVYGNLDDSDVLEKAVRDADLTLHFASADHEAAATAMTSSMADAARTTPKRLIHVSGAGILMHPDIDASTYGEASTIIWDDIKSIDDIHAIPDGAPHRRVDKIVLGAGLQSAIVCPPMIYGKGRGVGNRRSIQTPALARAILQRRQGFYVGAGKTRWCQVHIEDLSQVFLRLAEEAVKEGGGVATWGQQGYYYAESGEFLWSDISKALTAQAKKQGLVDSDEVVSLPSSEIEKMNDIGLYIWGGNSRCRASRARLELGWEPVKESIFDAGIIKGIVEHEKDLIDRGVEVASHS